MGALDRAFAKAAANPRRVILPETDPRILAAKAELTARGLAVPVPLADATDEIIAALMQVRGVDEPIARRMADKPLYRAAAMVTTGLADAMIAGAETATRRVIEAASFGIGLADGVSHPSSFFLMVFPDGRELIFSDCAMSVDPDAGDLAVIAGASARSATALLGRADVALLSYSTHASGAGPSVDKVRAAAEATGFTGPIQADAALNAAIAGKKGVFGGNANVLIFPTLDAGNIAYKLCQELGGAQAVGPFLQGFRRPVSDLSRGATVDDIVAATAISLATA